MASIGSSGENDPKLDAWHMQRALLLAAEGQGAVEPNPMVGCVIARGAEVIGEGFHQRFGGPHAEINAISVARNHVKGATMYVTLEPCCHHGKTPPCTDAILSAGIQHVVVAERDPFPQVSGGGIAALRAAAVRVTDGVLSDEAYRLNAPYHKLLSTGRPWVIAKWAMTLDGRIATAAGESRWISNESSRQIVHQLRGRVDAIMIGRGTAAADDPLLTARPPGPRIATRIVLDTHAQLALDSQLVKTSGIAPVIIAAGTQAPEARIEKLRAAGCEVLQCLGETPRDRMDWLLSELGRRRMTNVLCEGGGQLLGTMFDAGAVGEVHVFVAPKVFGGGAPAPVAGIGVAEVAAACMLEDRHVETIAGDVYIRGRIARPC